MKFKKTALAVAIAGIAAAPIASADVTLSGYLGFVLEATDEDGDDGNIGMGGDDSTLNVNSSHKLNSGLTGYGNWRVDAGLVGSTANADNVHVGIKGGFGDVRVGEVPDALEYGQKANDALFDIGGENFGISYTGSFGPATVGVNWSPEGTGDGSTSFAGDRAGSDKIAGGIKFGFGGFGIGVGAASIGDDTAFSAGASFGIGGASAAVALKNRDFDAGGERETISATLGFGIGGASAKLTYAVETGDVDEDDNLIRLDVGYGLGGGMNISGRVTSREIDDGAGDVVRYRVLLSKDF